MVAARRACLGFLLLVALAGRARSQPGDAAAPAASTADQAEAEDEGWEWSFEAAVDWFESDSARTVLQALLGLLVLVAGWPIARLLSAGASWLARRVTDDPTLVSLVGLPPPHGPLPIRHEITGDDPVGPPPADG